MLHFPTGQSAVLGHELANPPYVDAQWRHAPAVADAVALAARSAHRSAARSPRILRHTALRTERHLRHHYSK